MKRPLVVLTVIAAIGLTGFSVIGLRGPHGAKGIVACSGGGKRWAIKTLTDAAATSVRYEHPVVTTVAALAAQTPEAPIEGNTKRLPSETAVYEVTAKLVKAKISYDPSTNKGDQDTTLVIADPSTGATMVAELPKGGCAPESTSIKAKKMDNARQAFVAACGTPPAGHFRTLHGTAKITGVGFFDLDHGKAQTGRAPHYRELHPLLSFSAINCTS